MRRKWDKRLILADIEELETRRPREADEELRLWRLAACFFFLISCALLWYSEVSRSTGSARLCTHEQESPRLPLRQIKFTGGLKYDTNGKLYREDDPSIGLVREVDNLWTFFEEAQYTEFTRVSEDGRLVRERKNTIAGLDVFYQLHCLNIIRKELNTASPQDADISQHDRVHVDHCLDYVRQALMCHADTTPIKLRYDESAQQPIIDLETMHTCKDFDALMDWTISNRYQSPRLDLAR